jgi:serine/threonine protein kinase
MPYIAPEVLNGEAYTSSSDIYSFGVVMAELSSGKPPFYNKKHNLSLALAICNGLRPEFGKGTPEIYKKLAHRCMNANPNQRPTVEELYLIIFFWYCSIIGQQQQEEEFGYKANEVVAIFKEADEEIPNISTSYEKDPDAARHQPQHVRQARSEAVRDHHARPDRCAPEGARQGAGRQGHQLPDQQ